MNNSTNNTASTEATAVHVMTKSLLVIRSVNDKRQIEVLFKFYNLAIARMRKLECDAGLLNIITGAYRIKIKSLYNVSK